MIIDKVPSLNILFKWLSLPFEKESNFKKIEIYTTSSDNHEFINQFINTFNFDLSNIVVGPCMIGVSWEDFATEYDHDLIEFDSIYEANFIKMLKSNNIPLDYDGYCEIYDWKAFLYLLVDVIENVQGTDSLKFYNKKGSYAFYPYPPNSFGLYYKKMNRQVQTIIDNSIELGWNVVYYPNSHL